MKRSGVCRCYKRAFSLNFVPLIIFIQLYANPLSKLGDIESKFSWYEFIINTYKNTG